MVILIIVFVLATITLLIFFDGIINKCLRRKHPIANKKSNQNKLIKDLKIINTLKLIKI